MMSEIDNSVLINGKAVTLNSNPARLVLRATAQPKSNSMILI